MWKKMIYFKTFLWMPLLWNIKWTCVCVYMRLLRSTMRSTSLWSSLLQREIPASVTSRCGLSLNFILNISLKVNRIKLNTLQYYRYCTICINTIMWIHFETLFCDRRQTWVIVQLTYVTNTHTFSNWWMWCDLDQQVNLLCQFTQTKYIYL